MGASDYPSAGRFNFQCRGGDLEVGPISRSVHMAYAHNRRGTYRLLASCAGIDSSCRTFPGELLVQRAGISGPLAVAGSVLAGSTSGVGALHSSVQF